ncbi:MAG: prephenate dehydratase domain-containing protein [Thermoprotei archaeon]
MDEYEPNKTVSLDELREELNSVTTEIVALLRRRLELCSHVYSVKRATNTPILDLVREEELVSKLVGKANTKEQRVLVRLLREIMSACRSIQSESVIAVPHSMRNHCVEAARSVFGSSCSFSLVGGVEEAFRSVEVGSADFAVAPYEGTAHGGYPYTLDALIDSQLRIVGEIVLPVEYHIVSVEKSLSAIKVVCADVEAIWACQRFLAANLPSAKLFNPPNQRVTRRKGWAYLVGSREAEDTGLNILAHGVQDDRENATRFVVVGREGGFNPNLKGGIPYKTTVVFTAPNRPGVLAGILADFGSRGINLTMIGSRPLRKKKWEYAFIIDLDTSEGDPIFLEALEHVKPKTTLLRVLGSYPTLTADRPTISMGK